MNSVLLVGAGVAMLCCAGCEGGLFARKRPIGPEPERVPAAVTDPLLIDTIGAAGTLSELGEMRVRGFSLVVGLGEEGSSDCPTIIRDYLIDSLTKNFGPRTTGADGQRFSPGRMIDSRESAVVEVVGVVRPGATRGDVFDVRVEALPGTDTRSIEGGLLLPCELRMYDIAASGEALVTGRVVARAQGPIFVNPFAGSGEGAATADPRRGVVLGGGVTSEPRPVRLLCRESSYSLARRLESRINERFGQNPRAAEAVSRGYVQLNTPARFAEEPLHYHRLATALLMEDNPSFVDRKLADWMQFATEPGANLERISSLWEAVGRTAISGIQPLYDHADPSLAYFAARAGLRLGDANALPVIGQMAATPGHPHRVAAARELARTDLRPAISRLAALLDADDDEIRVIAYEGLAEKRHAAVRSFSYPHAIDREQVNVRVDVVDARGKPLIYVRRSGAPRIAIFGATTPVLTPVLFADPRLGVTISASTAADELTISVRERYGRPINDRIHIPARLIDVVGALADIPDRDKARRLRGAGLSYSQVVGILSRLVEQEAIPAELRLEQASITEQLGPAEDQRRPEGDERIRETSDSPSLEPDAPPAAPRGESEEAPSRDEGGGA
ncbi:MAG: flagellar basal body P-ring protein FlgI [Phycisphaerales bacterium]|nr:flagellar basal body P-ring protein FlgI [Phycisphaerales bacterium]